MKTFNSLLISALLISALLICIAGFTSCNNDDVDSVAKNTISFNGKTQTIDYFSQTYYGVYKEASDIVLILGNINGYLMRVELFSDPSIKKEVLTDGNYTQSNSYREGTWYTGDVITFGLKDELVLETDIISGTINVRLTGTEYAIDFDMMTSNSKSIKGNYVGKLNYSKK